MSIDLIAPQEELHDALASWKGDRSQPSDAASAVLHLGVLTGCNAPVWGPTPKLGEVARLIGEGGLVAAGIWATDMAQVAAAQLRNGWLRGLSRPSRAERAQEIVEAVLASIKVLDTLVEIDRTTEVVSDLRADFNEQAELLHEAIRHLLEEVEGHAESFQEVMATSWIRLCRQANLAVGRIDAALFVAVRN